MAITLLFTAVIAGNVALFKTGEHLISVITILLLSSIYLSIYLFRVSFYEVIDGALIIHRPVKNKKILLKDIIRGRKVEKETLKWTLRTLGNGGLFGYTGHFTHPKIGPMRWYVTRRDSAVLLQTKEGQNILLSPDEPEALLQALQR